MRTTNPKTLGAAARRMTSSILAALCLVAPALPVAAQDPAQPAANTQNTTDQPVSRPIPQRSIGLDPGKVVRWTLRDAIIAALDKNVDMELERETVKLAQYDVFQFQGYYDPVASSTMQYVRQIQPSTFTFANASDSVIRNDSLQANYGLRKNLERYGSTLEANFNNSRLGSNTNDLSTRYVPTLGVSFTQPLFKNFRIDPNRHALKLAKKRLDISDAFFRQRAIEIIAFVQAAYWDLALALRNEVVAREAVKLAETQLNQNKRQVEVGTLAPIDVVSAAASLEANRQEVFVRMDQVAQAENNLKSMTASGPDDDLWRSRIDPTESFEIKPFSLPLDDAVKLARQNRPEVQWFALQRESKKIDIDFYRNQAKPQIDLVGNYQIEGLGGARAINTGPNCNSPIDVNGVPSCYAINGVATINGVTVPTLRTFDQAQVQSISNVVPTFVGGYGTSLKNLFKNDFRTWSVGVQINFPLRNRAAQANLGRAREEDRQLDLQTRRQLQQIEVEVRNSVQSLETARARSDAAHAAKIYAEQQLEGEQKKFAAGMVGTFFVLQRQNELTQAQFVELQALADYNKSVAVLQRVLGTTLSSNNIEVKSGAEPTK
ncbi:MAG TPA: TolC family protein [Blastocatellia bacterium]|nr:TolC family protein [Blastocatellia bacterium]